MKALKIFSISILVCVVSSGIAQTYYVNSDNGLNLRKGPGASFETVMSLPGGSKLKVINSENEKWWEVEYKGNKGYVSAKYLIDNPGNSAKPKKIENYTVSDSGSKRNSSAGGDKSWAIGVRLGDPIGLTVKKYMSKSALELNLGFTHIFRGKGYYDDDFKGRYDANKLGYKDFQYIGHKASIPFGIQVHYLFRMQINKVAEEDTRGLEWYFGFGLQFRYQSYTYDYRYKLEGSPNWIYASGARVANIDVGPDGVIGLEYSFAELPISVFVDATLFVEFADNPVRIWPQGGIGGRYNF